MEGPPSFPANHPERHSHRRYFQPLDAPDTPDGATRRCPPPSRNHINSRGSTGNEEQAESQVVRYVFKKVLHKGHEFVPPPEGPYALFGAPIYLVGRTAYEGRGTLVRRTLEAPPRTESL